MNNSQRQAYPMLPLLNFHHFSVKLMTIIKTSTMLSFNNSQVGEDNTIVVYNFNL